MRNLALPLAAAVLMGFGILATTAAGKTAVIARCSISHLSINETGSVAATGKCIVGTKRVAGVWKYSYKTFDDAGFACNSDSVAGSSSSFVLRPTGSYRATGRVSLHSKVGKSRVVSKSVSAELGGHSLQCGGLDDLPAPSSLCPWATPWPGMGEFEKCGVANSWLSVSTPVSLNGNVVTAGHLASRNNYCRGTTGPIGNTSAPPSVSWLGALQQAQHFGCPDELYVRENALYVGVINQKGLKCYEHAPIGGLRNIQIPSNWGGTLYVVFAIGALQGHPAQTVAYETQTGVFTLTGSEDACSMLRERG